MDSTTPPGPESFQHTPVLVDRVVELFSGVPAGWILDATLGGGGHAAAILDARPDCTLVGIDQDDRAIAAARSRLGRFGGRAVVVRSRFDRLGEIFSEVVGDTGKGVSGVLFDLGVSSPQLDEGERGFSYRHDGPIDMRMDRSRRRSAAEIVNTAAAAELAATIRRYGDERYATRIAHAIVAARPLRSTAELAKVVADAVPAPARRQGHPARRTFQALRVAVNEELEILAGSIDQAVDLLLPGGRCVAMSYHSGEDRIVKERFRLAVTGGCECPVGLPCQCGAVKRATFVRRKALRPTPEEVAANPRSESVRLRVVEAIAPREADSRGSHDGLPPEAC
ncbi:MAG: 16S rRNA (cytosine(1402)-N(4))-methyltransferase RsmH [Microthrixaceae bacterium]|nr:16S rRNA (cytosine(1402)-N(4))-methyltransferase RsmH [Microthrixaceae bacterium]